MLQPQITSVKVAVAVCSLVVLVVHHAELAGSQEVNAVIGGLTPRITDSTRLLGMIMAVLEAANNTAPNATIVNALCGASGGCTWPYIFQTPVNVTFGLVSNATNSVPGTSTEVVYNMLTNDWASQGGSGVVLGNVTTNAKPNVIVGTCSR